MSVQGKLDIINTILKQLQKENPELNFFVTDEGKLVALPKPIDWDLSTDDWYGSGCVL